MLKAKYRIVTSYLPLMQSLLYRGYQKNDPIEDRFSAIDPHAAILFLEHYYDKRYKHQKY